MLPLVKVFAVTLLRTVFALCANFRVPKVSLKESKEGEMLAISTVLEFPPRESRSKNVSVLSLYRTNLLLSLPFDRAWMTDPNVDNFD